MIINFSKGDKLLCSVCNKEFVVDENTNYIINTQPVCSWKCFLQYVKESHRNKINIENNKK